MLDETVLDDHLMHIPRQQYIHSNAVSSVKYRDHYMQHENG
jgi:hypothetical protein